MIKLSQDRLGEILTLQQAVILADIVRAAQRNAKVEWLIDDTGGRTDTGTVRCVGDANGNFLNADDDIRDAFLRITTTSGWERFIPMKEVVDLVRRGYMVFNPD